MAVQDRVTPALAAAALLTVFFVLCGCHDSAPAPVSALQAEHVSAASSSPAHAAPSPTPAPTAAPAPTPAPTPAVTSFSMRFVGDLMCCEYQMLDALRPDGSYDFSDQVAAIRPELAGADVLLGNFETCLYSGKRYRGEKKGFNAPPAFLETVRDMGFDVLFTANNHALDYGVIGAHETLRRIRESGIVALGTNLTSEEAETVYIRNVNGVSVAILAYANRTNIKVLELDEQEARWAFNYHTEERLEKDVLAARALGAEVIVMYLYEGREKITAPNRAQREAAEHAFSQGVDAVIMSHTHSLLPMEKRIVTVDGREKTVFCAYGLGNFWSSAIHEESLSNIILNLRFTYNREKRQLEGIDADYVLTYTYNYYDEERVWTFSIVPLMQAIEHFDTMVDPRSRHQIDSFQRAFAIMQKRIGTEHANCVPTFSGIS